MKAVNEIYDEKVRRIQQTIQHEEPDIVPVMSLAESWVLGYAGRKITDVKEDPELELQCFEKMCQDIYFDALYTSALTRDVTIYEPMGGSPYFYSSDGVTVQHKEYVFMEADEYGKLAADPMKFVLNELYPRMYPALSRPYPENLEALKKSFAAYNRYLQKMMNSALRIKEDLGMPTMVEGIAISPVDILMSYFRGLKNIQCDFRRNPKGIVEAADALIPLVIENIKHGRTSLESESCFLIPTLLPTYMNAKQFEKIYWPSFKKLVDQIAALKGKMLIFMEGSWEHLYEFVNEIPRNTAVTILEKADIFKAKDLIGETVTIAGGMHLEQLRYMNRQECLDHAKKVVDYCAPGGGFIFTNDKTALAPNDVNVENLKAVNAFVHEYGKY